MRLCQPGPWRPAGDHFRRQPQGDELSRVDGARAAALLTTALASISSVSSGSTLYSAGLMRCESTRARSDPEVRREAGLLTVVGLSHAEDVAHRATRGVADDYQPACKHP